ncbi:hypothetical protein ACFQH8_01440 [Halomicroarcula sp. GCM10025710]
MEQRRRLGPVLVGHRRDGRVAVGLVQQRFEPGQAVPAAERTDDLRGTPSSSNPAANRQRRSREETSPTSGTRSATSPTSIWSRRADTGTSGSSSALSVALAYFRRSCSTSAGRYASRATPSSARTERKKWSSWLETSARRTRVISAGRSPTSAPRRKTRSSRCVWAARRRRSYPRVPRTSFVVGIVVSELLDNTK